MSKLEEIRQQLYIIETQVNNIIDDLNDVFNTSDDECINYELSDMIDFFEDLQSELDNKEDMLYLITKGE